MFSVGQQDPRGSGWGYGGSGNARPCFPALGPRGSGEAAGGQAGEAEIGVGEEAEVDGVAVQADILQCPAHLAVVLAVAERVLVHGLDVVVLPREGKAKSDSKVWGGGNGGGGDGSARLRYRQTWVQAHLTWRCRERRLSGRGAGI